MGLMRAQRETRESRETGLDGVGSMRLARRCVDESGVGRHQEARRWTSPSALIRAGSVGMCGEAATPRVGRYRHDRREWLSCEQDGM